MTKKKKTKRNKNKNDKNNDERNFGSFSECKLPCMKKFVSDLFGIIIMMLLCLSQFITFDPKSFSSFFMDGHNPERENSQSTHRRPPIVPPSDKFRLVNADSPAFQYCRRRMEQLNIINQTSHESSFHCYEPVEMKGNWKIRQPTIDPPLAAPFCCGWDVSPGNKPPEPGYFKLHPEYCGKKPLENKRWYTGRNDGYHQHMGGHACSCQKRRNFNEKYIWNYESLYDYNQRKSYTHQYHHHHHQRLQQHSSGEGEISQEKDVIHTSSTAWQRFDAQTTCQLLGNRTVLMTGDSTMGQTATTLMNSLIPGNCGNQIVYALSDTLYNQSYGRYKRGSPFPISYEIVQPNIVIYSLGAHIYGEDNWQYLFDDLNDNIIAKLRKKNPDTMFVYKTQQPGGCSTEPNSVDTPDVQARHHWMSSITTGIKKEKKRDKKGYNWNHFYGRDLYALGRLWDQPVLDLRMLYNRGDAHVDRQDCLHLCSPGPLDVVPFLFQRLLLLQYKDYQ